MQKQIFKLKLLLTLGLGLFLSACSTQWWEVTSKPSATDVISILDQVLGDASASSLDSAVLQEFIEIKNDPNSTIYFAEAPGEMGSVASISSLYRYDFMGEAGQEMFLDTIEEVRIFFVYLPQSYGNKAALLMEVKLAGQDGFITQVFSTNTPPVIEGGQYVATLGSGGEDLLVLRSQDLQDDELGPVIQLKVSDFDSQTGVETANGQFSVLFGYGP